MTHSTHEHQWVYLADLVIVVSRNEQDADLRRGEYCIGCSSLRVLFPTGWSVIRGDATKEFLARFEKVDHGNVIPFPPKEYRIRAPKKEPTRLGRGLAELLRNSRPISMPGVAKKNQT
jgi:hypothetical protein